MSEQLAKTNPIVSPFYSGTNFQFAWNSSALGALKECARKFEYLYIQGWLPAGEGIHLRFGRLFQDALDYYDRLRIQGMPHEDALDDATAWILKETWDGRNEESPGAPWKTDHTKKNRETLLRSVIWYIEHYINDPTRTVILDSGLPAIELQFKLEIPFFTPRDEPYLLTGRIDRLVLFGEDKFVMDRKTTGGSFGVNYFESYSPDNQMSLYTYGARAVYDVPVAGVIIDAAQIAVGFTRFERGVTTRSDGQLSEWLADTGYWLKLAEIYAENQYWPMNDRSCHNYGGCPFRSVCNKDPKVRENFLRSHFIPSTHNSDRILNDV